MADGSPAEKGNEVIEFQFVKSSFSHFMSDLTQVPLSKIKPDSCFNFASTFISFCFLLPVVKTFFSPACEDFLLVHQFPVLKT